MILKYIAFQMTNQLSLLDTQKMVALIMNLISLKCDHSRAKHT